MISKVNSFLAGKIYEIKKEYPIIHQFQDRMREVEMKLNNNQGDKCSH